MNITYDELQALLERARVEERRRCRLAEANRSKVKAHEMVEPVSVPPEFYGQHVSHAPRMGRR